MFFIALAFGLVLVSYPLPTCPTMILTKVLIPLGTVSVVFAETHHLFSGFFSGSTIAGIEFDDLSSSLTLVKNISSEASGSKWITLDVRHHDFSIDADILADN
jgi:hypothetical protein